MLYVALTRAEERLCICGYKMSAEPSPECWYELCRKALSRIAEEKEDGTLVYEVAQEADFFSFGTNDLTQMTFGFSRDDIGAFLPEYLKQGVLEADPFQTLDQRGVGMLIEHAVAEGRESKPNLKIGICGEHGGDPESVEFCHREGFSYVSCSPFRVPIARLAAAQAAAKEALAKKRK